jgi:hypothetical protein
MYHLMDCYNSTRSALLKGWFFCSSGTFSNGAISYIAGATATANTFGSTDIVHSKLYRSTNTNLQFSDGVDENNATLALAQLYAGLWSNTAAITSITLDAYLR